MKSQGTVRIEVDPACGMPEVVIRTDQKTEAVERLASVIERYMQNDVPRIAVYDGGATRLIEPFEILRVYTEARKLMVCTDSGTYEARCSLQEMEKKFDPDSFVRISRFELINMEKVSGFDVSVSGTIQVRFDDGSATWVARRFVRAIEQRLDQLNGMGGQSHD